MQTAYIALIFFFYGLAFFCMGLAITLELGHGSDVRLRRALRPLAGFGFLHGAHEWLEMFENLEILPYQQIAPLAWEGLRLALLALSFVSLGAFGGALLAKDERHQRLSLLWPVSMVAVWGLGLFIMRGRYPFEALLDVTDVWTRYVLAVPSALLACGGLIVQQREFRRAGMAQFGRDSLWAAIAFAWYGIVGQTFTRSSLLPPSTFINQNLFWQLFGFPVQLLRAAAAVVAAVFVMRFLRSFEVETRRQIATLQASQLQEAQRREALRGELLRRVVEAQETERQRVGRELHDETGQALTAIGLGLRGIAGTIRQDVEKATTNLRQLERLIDHSLNELQRLITDLRPSHLDDLGLPAALRWYAGEVQSRSSLQVSVEVVGESRPLATEMKTTLFRIAQEALTNVVRHANADQVHLHLICGEETVSMQIEDDGCGFNLSDIAIAKRPAWGLEGMRERAALLGGEFSLKSAPRKGTRVEVVLPYAQKTEVNSDHSPASGG